MTDDGSDNASGSQAGNIGAGKDVLFGWLVGRAAADLGLAQALAATEAQQAEKFKRLEERLLAQIRELQSQSNLAADSGHQITELDKLKVELENAVERMGGLESLAQQLTQAPYLASTQIQGLESTMGERQNLLEAQYSQIKQLTDTLCAKIDEFERQTSSLPQGFDRALGDLAEIKVELLAIASRMARLESSSAEMQNKTASDIEHVQDLAAALIRTQTADLEARMVGRLGNQSAIDTRFQTVEAMFQRGLDNLRREISCSTESFNSLAADLAEIRTCVLNLTRDVDSVRSAMPATDLDTERTRISQEIKQRVTASLGEIGDAVHRRLQDIDDLKSKRDNLSQGIETLLHRMGKLEQASQQTAAEFRRELDSLKTMTGRQSSTHAQLEQLEQDFGVKLREIEKHLAHERERLQAGDSQDREFKDQLEHLVARTGEIEAMAHQTRALMINETSQSAQQRDGLMLELAALRGQLQDGQGWDAAIRALEASLNAKLHDLENKLAQKIPGPGSPQSELGELKAQLQNLNEKMNGVEHRLPSNSLRIGRDDDSGVKRRETMPRPLAAEDHLKIGTPRAENVRRESQQLLKEADRPNDQGLVHNEDPLRLLEARMSADIERARAELREKSGRWKARP